MLHCNGELKADENCNHWGYFFMECTGNLILYNEQEHCQLEI